METQNTTGQLTEDAVKRCLEKIGLRAEKPIPDIGVDLNVYNSKNPDKKTKVQIKGRGEIQKNKRYRWFQIRTTEKQRELAVKSGLLVSESWKKKVDLCDFFVLVSLKYNEHWVFPKIIIHELININKIKYGNRADNKSGQQAEIDLDINFEGLPLTEKYASYLNNYQLIVDG